jgi:PAS domain S-box-containing protein
MEDIKKHNLINQTSVGKNTAEFEPSNKVETELASSHEYFGNIFNACLDGILVGNPDGYVTMVNKAATQILGYSQDEMVGKHPLELGLTPPEEKESGRDVIEILLAKGSLYGLKRRWIRKDGTPIDIEMNLSLMKDKNGNIVGSAGSFRDISENKKAEGQLRESRDFLENIIESSLDAIVVTDEQGYVTNANSAFCQLTGYEKTDVLGKHMSQFAPMEPGNYHCTTGELIQIDKEFGNNIEFIMTAFSERKVLKNRVGFYLRKDKKIVPVESNIVFLFNNNGEKLGAFAAIEDITERRKANKALKEGKEFLERIIEDSWDGIAITDATGHILSVNNALLKMSSFSKKELIGSHSSVFTIDDKDLREEILQVKEKLYETGHASFQSKHKVKGEGHIDVECSTSLIKGDDENYIAGITIIRDITDRKRAEKALRKSEEKYYKLIENANDAIISTDLKGTIVGFNRKAEQMFGYSREEILGKSSTLLVAEQSREEQQEEWQKLEEIGSGYHSGKRILEWTALRKDGEEFPVEFTFYSLEIGGEVITNSIIRDVSKRKEEEKKLITYQKKLKDLTNKLLFAEQKERQHFADFLHDEIGQQLFATRLKLELLKASISSVENTKTLDNALNTLYQVINQSRNLTSELSSPILKGLGLEKALEWLAEETYKKYDLMVTFEDDRQEKPLGDNMKSLLYQAVGELLTNVAKHSQTKHSSVSIKRDNSTVRISVEDKGVGFLIPDKDFSDAKIEGFGLFRIKERLEPLGGQLEIKSQPNLGTQIILTAPLKNTT